MLLACEAPKADEGRWCLQSLPAFAERGQPNVTRSNNGLPFASPKWLYNLSKLSVWWLRPGITLERIRPGHLQQNESDYPFHDKDILVTACGRICMHCKKINISTVMAGQRLGIKEVEDGIWLVSFLHYDLRYTDLEQKTLQTIDNPHRTRGCYHVLGTFCYRCLRYGQKGEWCARGHQTSFSPHRFKSPEIS